MRTSRTLGLSVLPALSAALLLSGCGQGGHEFAAADTTIRYAFVDSSVPPEYHRSFTLTVADGQGSLVVQAYGDELASDEQPVSDESVQSLLDAYTAGDLDDAFDPDDPEGCAGGTTFSLSLDDGTESVSTDVYRCNANEAGSQALYEAAAPLLTTFDIDGLTEGRYRPVG